MTEWTRVVVHYTDGKIVKGTTQDFFPNRPSFHLIPADGGQPVQVFCRLLKAAFFVKTFEGNRRRRDLPGFIAGPQETQQGKKVTVHFKDGELLCGYANSYLPDREGFFLFPSDSGSNNMRVYVVTAAALEVKIGPAAEALAQKVLARNPSSSEPGGS